VLLCLTRSRGTTLVLVTHDAELARSANRTLELRDGKLVPGEPLGQRSPEGQRLEARRGGAL
jgi:ABC-type lipoprotein export system ATPase subunit